MTLTRRRFLATLPIPLAAGALSAATIQTPAEPQTSAEPQTWDEVLQIGLAELSSKPTRPIQYIEAWPSSFEEKTGNLFWPAFNTSTRLYGQDIPVPIGELPSRSEIGRAVSMMAFMINGPEEKANISVPLELPTELGPTDFAGRVDFAGRAANEKLSLRLTVGYFNKGLYYGRFDTLMVPRSAIYRRDSPIKFQWSQDQQIHRTIFQHGF
jgi:hypothetical protein